MDPARMFKESLTSRPELENSQGQTRKSAMQSRGLLCPYQRTLSAPRRTSDKGPVAEMVAPALRPLLG